jgi:hypothetical protein
MDQKYTPDKLITFLKRGIRRNNKNLALFAGNKLYNGSSRKKLIKQLIVITSEDIGISNRSFPGFLASELKDYKKLDNEKKKKNIIMRLICLLCNSKKSRWCDELIHGYMESPVKDNAFDFDKRIIAKKGVFKRRRGYSKQLIEGMDGFITAIRAQDVVSSCIYTQWIFDIMEDTHKPMKNSRGKLSKDPIYVVWDALNKTFFKYPPLKTEGDTMRALFKFFDKVRDGKTERLFLVHAILIVCNAHKSKEYIAALWNFEMNEQIQDNVKIPDWTLDKYTKDGEMDLVWFWDHGAKLENAISSPYTKRAKLISLQRQQEKILCLDSKKKKGKTEKEKKRKREKKKDNYEDEEKEYRYTKKRKILSGK